MGGIHEVSIHAPREGERLITANDFVIISNVSIHAPREGERRNIKYDR